VRGFLAKHPEEACALHERAITLNPNLALAWCFSGLSHVCLGRHEDALRRINQAILLSPADPHRFVFDAALIVPSLMTGDCPGAVEAGRRAVELNPLFSFTYQFYLAALGWMQLPLEAREVLDRLLGLEPDFSVEAAMLRLPLRRGEDVARYAEGLRRAGLRERGVTPPPLALEHSVIDLVVEAPHSPSVMRIGSHRAGRAENDANR
jgi:tetratricopeptide (TPR) repeat protein